MNQSPVDRWPANPRVLRFRGQPTLVITSAEHYGAVFNLDFDYHLYLAELTRCRFNYTRTASGTFVENEETIEGSGWENTQAPRPLRYVCPWARSSEPGYSQGGQKFDLSVLSTAYVERLCDFVHQASLRGIIVEFTLFTAQYSEGHWAMSPMHADNNVNELTPVQHHEVYRLANGGLLDFQLAFVKNVVTALAAFDNVIIEIMNEPYFSGVEAAWVDAVIETIQAALAEQDTGFLIGWNYANVRGRVEGMNPAIGYYTFHYCSPPDVVEENYDLELPVVYDETGYAGVDDSTYRRHAWEFLLAGGTGFNHLDYSFGPGSLSSGTRKLPGNASGGGGPAFRDQITVLVDFMAALPFAQMKPVTMVATTLDGTAVSTRQLADPGRAYAFYLQGREVQHITFEAEPGEYTLTWIEPLTGFCVETPHTIAVRGAHRIAIPAHRTEIAARLLPAKRRAAREVGDFDFVEAARGDHGRS